MTEIHVRAFTGSHLRNHVHSIAKLRLDILEEYPFFEKSDLYQQLQFLERYVTCKEAIGILVFDHSTLVGASMGIPLMQERMSIQAPLQAHFHDIHSFYYFGESMLLKPYRNRGIGHHFFDMREAHVQLLQKYTHICFLDPLRPDLDHRKPADYLPVRDFWKKRGYAYHPEITCVLSWKDADTHLSTSKTLAFWLKKCLSPTNANSRK